MLALPQPSVRSLQHIYQVQLGRFVENHDFLPDVKELMTPLVSASIAIYFKMCVNMLPTPAKSHYTFNLRDLSKVYMLITRHYQYHFFFCIRTKVSK